MGKTPREPDFGLLGRVGDLYRNELGKSSEARDWFAAKGLTDLRVLERFGVGYAPGTLRSIIPSEKRVHRALRGLGLFVGRGPGREHLAGCVVVPLSDPQGRTVELVGYPLAGGAVRRAGAVGAVFNWPTMKSRSEVRLLGDPLAALLEIARGNEAIVAILGDEWTEITDATFQRLAPHRVVVDQPRRRQAVLEHLKRLGVGQGGVAPAEPQEGITVENGFPAAFGRRRYLVQAVTQDKPRHLRALVRAVSQAPGRFHLDSIDLYSSQDRAVFVREAALLFGEDPALVEADLARLISLAEEYLRRGGKGPTTELTDEARKEAMELLRDPKLLELLLADFGRLGIVGEEENALAGYLVAVSRKMEDPLSILILSRSAAGKSTLAEAVASLVPPEDAVYLTRLTGQALFYQKSRSFRHKLLVVEEETGVMEAAYPLRVLQSAKRLAVATPQGSHEVEGPVAVLVTTTSTKLNDETRSRFLVVSVDESQEQTRAILEAQRRKEAGERHPREEILRRHYALQRCLRPLRVINPYARYLTFPDRHLSTRREQPKYLALIRAVAFLRQYQRKEKDGVIEVELADIEVAHELADAIVGQSMEDLSPPGRRLLEGLFQWRPKGLFTRREASAALAWPGVQVWTYMKELVGREWVLSRGGRPEKLELAWDGREGKVFLGLRPIGEIRAKIAQNSGSFGRRGK